MLQVSGLVPPQRGPSLPVCSDHPGLPSKALGPSCDNIFFVSWLINFLLSVFPLEWKVQEYRGPAYLALCYVTSAQSSAQLFNSLE